VVLLLLPLLRNSECALNHLTLCHGTLALFVCGALLTKATRPSPHHRLSLAEARADRASAIAVQRASEVAAARSAAEDTAKPIEALGKRLRDSDNAVHGLQAELDAARQDAAELADKASENVRRAHQVKTASTTLAVTRL